MLAAGMGLGRMQLLGSDEQGLLWSNGMIGVSLRPSVTGLSKAVSCRIQQGVVCGLRAELAQPVTLPATLVLRGSCLQ